MLANFYIKLTLRGRLDGSTAVKNEVNLNHLMSILANMYSPSTDLTSVLLTRATGPGHIQVTLTG